MDPATTRFFCCFIEAVSECNINWINPHCAISCKGKVIGIGRTHRTQAQSFLKEFFAVFDVDTSKRVEYVYVYCICLTASRQ